VAAKGRENKPAIPLPHRLRARFGQHECRPSPASALVSQAISNNFWVSGDSAGSGLLTVEKISDTKFLDCRENN